MNKLFETGLFPRVLLGVLTALALVACDGDGREMDSGPNPMDDAGPMSDSGPGDPDGGPSTSCETEGARRCGAGGTIEECQSGVYQVVASCAVGCGEGVCLAPPECVGTETRCNSNVREQCVAGMYVAQETCSEGCSAGACLSGPCTDGVERCDGLELQVCSSETWTTTETCTTACVAEACSECTAGATRCDGDDLQSCSGGTFVSSETCAYGCDADACNPPPTCTDGMTLCMGAEVHTCSGGTYGLTETCAEMCEAGECTTSSSDCTDGMMRCGAGNIVESCVGTSWTTTESCAFACDAGACTSAVTCTPGASRCNGDIAEICNSSGSAYLYLDTCPVSCSAGLCTGTCTAGDRRCNGTALEECATGGSTWDVVETCTAFCEPASRTCAFSGLDIATNQDLDGDIIVDGAFVLRSGATVTSPTGNLTIRATSITIETGASIVATAATPASTSVSYSNSSSCSSSYRGRGGARSTTSTDVRVGPGGPGTRGRSRSASYNSGTGGAGGGVVRLIADTAITVAGAVRADGGNGGSASGSYSAGGGGGAGGGILLVAPSLSVTDATLSARGGTGGTSGYCSSMSGSAGQDGYIKTFSDAEGVISGATIDGTHVNGQRPPLVITSSTHPNEDLVYNDGFEQVTFTWSRPFEVTGYFHTVNTSLTSVPNATTGTFAESELTSRPRADIGTGTNYFHIVPINVSSSPGTIQNYYRVQVNATPPNAVSASHGSASTWYPSANPFFEWTLPHDSENYRGYYYVLDQFGDTVPDETDTWLDVSQLQILLSGISPGVHMFHIVSVDQQGYRTTAADHVRVNIGDDPGVGTVYGRVRTSAGDDLPGATVTINRGLLVATNPNETTIANGAYNHMGVPVGTWVIQAEAEGYMPASQTVTVTDAGMHAVDLNLTPL